MKNDHLLIHGDLNAIEYYTPSYIMEPVRRVLGEIDFDPASCSLANLLVMAKTYVPMPSPLSEANNMDGLPRLRFLPGGLGMSWRGRVWLNHPFGREELPCNLNCKKRGCVKRGYHIATVKPGSYQWIKKLVDSFKSKITVAAATITFSNTDARWFHLLAPHPQVFLKGRVNFMVEKDGKLVESGGSSKGAVLTFLGVDPEIIYQNFNQLGVLKIGYKSYPSPL